MILEFIIFAVICLVFIAVLLNKKWELVENYNNNINFINLLLNDFRRQKEEHVSEVDDLQSRLALSGKNYIEMKNKLKDIALHKQNLIDVLLDDIKKLKKLNENKKATPKRQSRQTVQRTNKKKV